MATADRKVRILTPSLQSMNKLLLEMVEYQSRKSAVRFWDDVNRSGSIDRGFDQAWFSEWKTQEVSLIEEDYRLIVENTLGNFIILIYFRSTN